jgi:hypothetical protein
MVITATVKPASKSGLRKRSLYPRSQEIKGMKFSVRICTRSVSDSAAVGLPVGLHQNVDSSHP